jgi:hypothetical protein
MQCPVCGAPAKHFSNEFEVVSIACRRCGNYQVADAAFNALLRLDAEARTRALRSAKKSAPAGATPTIAAVPRRSSWQRLWRPWA